MGRGPRSTIDDAFRHHPALHALITPPNEPRLRGLTPGRVRQLIIEHGPSLEFIQPDDKREICRNHTMQGRLDDDLWVFGCGSLMWGPRD